MNKVSRAMFSSLRFLVFVPVERSTGSTSSVEAGGGVGDTVDPYIRTIISTCLGTMQTECSYIWHFFLAGLQAFLTPSSKGTVVLDTVKTGTVYF